MANVVYQKMKILITSSGARQAMGACAMALVLAFALFSGAVLTGAVGDNVDVAYAVEYDNGPDYADALLGDNGWKGDVIEDAAGINGDDVDQDLLSSVDEFLLTMSRIIVAFCIIFSVGRIAIRGIIQVLYSDGSGTIKVDNVRKAGQSGKSNMFTLFMTAEERESKTMNDAWVFPMMKETAIFLLIGLTGAFVIALLAMFAQWGLQSFINDAPSSVKSFDVGGINVTTQ